VRAAGRLRRPGDRQQSVGRDDPRRLSDNLPVCVTKYIPLHTPAVVQSINAILADLQSKGRPGAGFVPVPA
jgi:hypothetical protein